MVPHYRFPVVMAVAARVGGPRSQCFVVQFTEQLGVIYRDRLSTPAQIYSGSLGPRTPNLPLELRERARLEAGYFHDLAMELWEHWIRSKGALGEVGPDLARLIRDLPELRQVFEGDLVEASPKKPPTVREKPSR